MSSATGSAAGPSASTTHSRCRTPSSSTTSDRRGACGQGREDRARPARSIGIQADDRARVDAGRPEQPVAVLARGRERSLVRQDAGAGLEWLEAEPGEEAALGPLGRAARHRVRLLVDVDRRARILVERPIGPPRGERPGDPPVAIVLAVADLVGGRVEADDVAVVPGDQAAPVVRREHVVRRSHDRRRVPDRLGVVAKGAERTDLGQRAPRMEARLGRGHGAPVTGRPGAASYDSPRDHAAAVRPGAARGHREIRPGLTWGRRRCRVASPSAPASVAGAAAWVRAADSPDSRPGVRSPR